MRQEAEYGSLKKIVQAPLDHWSWYHLIPLQTKLTTKATRMAYARLAVENGWSRNVLVHHIELKTAERIGTRHGYPQHYKRGFVALSTE